MKAGINGYIEGISENPKIKAIQLWQFLGFQIFFRLSSLSNYQKVCNVCGNHTIYPSEFNITCIRKTKKYDLSNFPIPNISKDGYSYNKKNLKGCYKNVFN